MLSRSVAQIKGLNVINQLGINFLSETVFIPVFKELYHYNDLENLNTAQSNNFPGIDIGDKKRRLAFQITATVDSEKIRHTLRQFTTYELFKDFDLLYIYCLTEKPKLRADTNYVDVTEGKYTFTNEQILDYKDILKVINSLTDYDCILRIERVLTKQFSDAKLESYKNQLESPVYETLHTNLLRISLPSTLYTARITITAKDLTRKRGWTDREVIYQYKRENNLRFSADWIDYGKQLYTFHDLSNRSHDISYLIDPGTVEKLSPEEFYLQSVDHERAFKALLKFCLSKHAHFLDIDFDNELNIFVFRRSESQNIVRKESWNSGRRSASREVVRLKLHKDGNNIWYCTHLAFAVGFKYFEGQWYLEISPDWYVSRNGVDHYPKMDKQVVSWLKRTERNLHVFNNVKFIANYLKYGKTQVGLFDESENQPKRPKNFITFLNLESFKNAPLLNEEDWKSTESAEMLSTMSDKEGNVENDL